jgi:hypothetical protein
MDTRAGDKELLSFQRHRDATMLKLFNIDESKTKFEPPRAYFEGRLDEDDVYELKLDYEAQFVISKLSWDDQQAAEFKELGWDLTNDRGQPLEITKSISRVIEAVAKGIKGRPPSDTQVSLERFSKNMEEEAAKFLQDKRREKKAG